MVKLSERTEELVADYKALRQMQNRAVIENKRAKYVYATNQIGITLVQLRNAGLTETEIANLVSLKDLI